MVGRSVLIEHDSVQLVEGGNAGFAVDLPYAAGNVQLSIEDFLKGPKSFNAKMETLTAKVIREKYLRYPTGIPYQVRTSIYRQNTSGQYTGCDFEIDTDLSSYIATDSEFIPTKRDLVGPNMHASLPCNVLLHMSHVDVHSGWLI